MKTMNRRRFLEASALAVSAAALAACGEGGNSGSTAQGGQPEGKVYKVGIIQYVQDASLDQIAQAIQDGLEARGKELGVTFSVDLDNGNADPGTLNQIIADQLASGMQLLIPIATPVATMCMSATEDNAVPVVYSAVSDPEGAGLTGVANITGTSDGLDTNKVFNLITAANPEIKKIGFLYDNGQDSSIAAIEAARAFCQEAGIAVVEKTGTNATEISQAVESLIAEGVEAIFTPTDNTIMTAELAIYERLQQAKIPHYAGADSFALNGAFVGYGVDYYNLGLVTADLAVEILTEDKQAGDIDFVTFDNGTCTINTETCAAMGFDLEAIKTAFEPYCLEIKTLETAESF